MPGNDVDVFDEEKVLALRKRIGEYIKTTGFDALREKYHYSIQLLSGEETFMKDDPYYSKYYKMLEDGKSKDDVIAVIVSDLENDTSIQGKVDVDTFRVAGPNDPSENEFNEEEVLVPARLFLHDYFNDEKELNDMDMKEVFLENIEKPQPCPPCARCPEPSFDCKKVPNYSSTNSEYLPVPVLNDFSQFGM